MIRSELDNKKFDLNIKKKLILYVHRKPFKPIHINRKTFPFLFCLYIKSLQYFLSSLLFCLLQIYCSATCFVAYKRYIKRFNKNPIITPTNRCGQNCNIFHLFYQKLYVNKTILLYIALSRRCLQNHVFNQVKKTLSF